MSPVQKVAAISYCPTARRQSVLLKQRLNAETIAEMMLLKMVLVVGLCWLAVADQQPTLLQPTHCWFLVKNETDDLQTPKNTI